MYVEQAFGAETSAQEVHLCQTAAPSFEPQHQLPALIFRAFEVQKYIDVAARAGSRVLGAADEVEGFDSELFRIELSRDALRHAIAPTPVLVAGAPEAGHPGLNRSGFLERWREGGEGLVEFGIHQYAQNLAIGFARNVDNAQGLRDVREFG